jgi:hypothetical protein
LAISSLKFGIKIGTIMEHNASESNVSDLLKRNKKFMPPVAKPGLTPGALKPKDSVAASSSNNNTEKKAPNLATKPEPKSSSSGVVTAKPAQPPVPEQPASSAIQYIAPDIKKPSKKPEKPSKSKAAVPKPAKTKGNTKKGPKAGKLDEEEAASEASDEEEDGDYQEESDEPEEVSQLSPDKEDSVDGEKSKKQYKLPIGLYNRRTRESLLAKYNITETVEESSPSKEKVTGGHTDEESSRNSNLRKKAPPVIALSGFSPDSKAIQQKLAKTLKLQIQETEMLKFDILVVDSEKPARTKKVLFALVRQVPIVGPSYLFECVDSKKLINPAPHQVPGFAKLGSRPKYDQIFEKLTINVDIVQFEAGFDYPSIYGLLKMCKASLVQDAKQADLIVSNKNAANHTRKSGASEQEARKVHQTWVFDCIETGILQDNTKYLF